MTLQLVAFNSDSCGYPRRAFIGPAKVTLGELSPAEQRWSAGQTVMTYPTDYSSVISAWMPKPSPTLELRRLIDSQPKVGKNQSPFRPIDTSRHELPSEAALARAAGRRLLSLDMPSGDADALTLGDTVVSSNDTPYTAIDPTTMFRIESERQSALSGPLLRTHLERDADGRPRIRTRGAPWRPRIQYDRRSGKYRQLGTRGIPTERAHYAWLEDRFSRWMRSWTDATTLPQLEQVGRALRFQRVTARRPMVDGFDPDPYRFRFLDLELHEPYDEAVVEVTDDMAYEAFGRPLELLYDEEIQELTEAEAERLGSDAPRVAHLRTHKTWATAPRTRLNSHGAEYLAAAADILG